MNAPDRLGLTSILGSLTLSYAPLVDHERRTFGTRLTMLSVKPSDRLPVGLILAQLNGMWPESRAMVLVAPLDAQLDDSLLDWQPAANAVIEIPTIALRDPTQQALVQRAHRVGIKMALRGRPDVPLPPALLDCFDYALIHITEDRRRRSDGSNAPPPPGVMRRMPFIITGAFRVTELQAAYERGAVASVGMPIDEAHPTIERPPQPNQAAVLELLRLAHERADIDTIELAIKRDTALSFELIRFVNSAAFAVPMQVASVKRAVMVLGHAKMTRWLSRMLRVSTFNADALPLMHAGIRRGMFLEHLASCSSNGAELRDSLFQTGAFSLLDRMTGTSFPRLLQHAQLPPSVAAALLERKGPCAPYLMLAEAVERNDPVTSRKQREALDISLLDCNVALLRALAAAQTMHPREDRIAA
ncbi:MAG TPA: HDOD domain-containing protein [Burkholderiaceae bacterium]|nr:HDOD domain-containing protein [Burkholderiaceae bacterium]